MAKYSEPFDVILDSTEESKRYCIKNPTHEELMIFDMEYKRIFSVAVREGVMTIAEANKQMKDSGAWTDEDMAEVSRYMAKLARLGQRIKERKESEEVLDKAANEATITRNELMFKMRIQTEILDKTAEGMADMAKIYKSIRYCLVYSDNKKRVFDDKDEFEAFTEENPTAISFIYRKTFLFEHDIDENMSESWQETMYLKDRAEQLRKEADEVAQKTEQQSQKQKKKKKKKVAVGDK